jgi:hypothetical protein
MAAPESAVNISYLACALQVLTNYGREPQFSLDPKDPHNISGDFQVKKFYPQWLAGTVAGEVLFQADYVLKELCMGDRSLPDLPSPLHLMEAQRSSGDHVRGQERAARQWFVVRRAGITVAADGALVPFCEMGVEARRLVPSATGYTDAAHTDPREPMVQMARAVTERFADVARRLPVVNELLELTKAIVIARYLLECGCQQNRSVMESFTIPYCPEGQSYCMEIPTLKTQRNATQVSDNGGKVSIHKRQRSMHGGVDLGLPEKKVSARQVRRSLLEPRERRLSWPLPLFVQPMAAAAA